MVRSALRNFSIVICLFMMCPRRTNFAAPPPIQKLEPVTTVIVPPEESEPKFTPENIESIVTTEVKTTKNEPGFDLTDEEIVKFKIWPQGVIPYYIDVYSYSDKVLRDRIRGFLNTVSSITSLNFLELPSPPKEEESRWVFFINRRGLLGCADHSTKKFTNTGVQKVILGYDCMSTRGELAEAVLAIAGVPPQHNSPDRDKYISITEHNIMADKKYLFAKLNNNEWLFHDIEYDFASASHYHSHKYSVNGKATIEIKEKYGDNSVGESKVFSEKDILKINMLYNFISKKKQHISDCHKLFEPGSNFNKYKPNNLTILPRKKPKEYTGLTNDVFEDNVKEKFTIPQKSESDESKKENINTDEVFRPNNEEDQEFIQNFDESGNDEQPTRKPLSLKNNQLSFKRDPLTYLSDYKTSDEGKQLLKFKNKAQHLAFGKPGNSNKYNHKMIKNKYQE